MSIKAIYLPHLRRSVFLGGRRRPAPDAKKLKLSKYLCPGPALPPPPSALDLSAAGQPGLSNVFLNDRLGCCVIAAGAHIVALETGNAGAEFVYTDGEITENYSAIGGYVPGDPSTDNGCDEVTAFQYWQKTGFANGTKLAAWFSLDPTNQAEIATAAWLTENLFFGCELPDAWLSPFPSAPGFVWDVATPDPSNGHAFMCPAKFDPSGVQVDTWGLIGTITWAAVAALCAPGAGGELYALLTPDQLAKATQKAPNGLDWASLQADLAALRAA